jgi:hypothetical protein
MTRMARKERVAALMPIVISSSLDNLPVPPGGKCGHLDLFVGEEDRGAFEHKEH